MKRNNVTPSQVCVGEEVIINHPGHPKHNEVGIYVGLNTAQAKPRARVPIDGHVYLCDPTHLIEN